MVVITHMVTAAQYCDRYESRSPRIRRLQKLGNVGADRFADSLFAATRASNYGYPSCCCSLANEANPYSYLIQEDVAVG